MGGQDGTSVVDLPLSLKVKHTFIDVNSSFVEDDAEGDDGPFQAFSGIRKRQVSEPAPCLHRQLSGRSPVADARASALAVNSFLELEEEEAEGDELEESDEPETEKDPCWVLDRQLSRQETEQLWQSEFLGRQVTEQCWPSWGLPANSGAAAWQVDNAAGEADAGKTGGAEEEPMLVHPQAAPLNNPTDPNLAAGMWLFQMSGLMGLPGGPQQTAPDSARDEAVSAAQAAASAPGAWGVPAAASAGAAEASGAGFVGMPGAVLPPGSDAMPPEWASTSTVMMRNLPNKYTQHMLLEELNTCGFLGTFDFMYLPIDPDTNANRGYAFINFIDPSYAWMLRMAYEGRKMSRFNSDKVVSVAPAALQGFEANYAHYSTARVNRGDPAARPLFLRESSMRHFVPKPEGSRRRGGRRSAGSLIDIAARRQQQHHQGALTTAVKPQPFGKAAAATASMAAAPATGSANQPAPRFCPYCGGKCQPMFRFCQFCGASLSLGSN